MKSRHRKAGAVSAALALFFFLLPAANLYPEAVPADSFVEERKLVALTFDDGPRRSTTSALLDGLSQRGVQATFFLIGEQIPGNEDLLRRMEADRKSVV